jgi:butyrate kinase
VENTEHFGSPSSGTRAGGVPTGSLVRACFEHHLDAEILRSLPGLSLVLGAQVHREFGDDRLTHRDQLAHPRAF